MSLFLINREERHFGFLFFTLLVTNIDFRSLIFERINTKTHLSLDPESFDIYAEVAILRDYWFSLGDFKNYDLAIENRRRLALTKILETMGIDKSLIDRYKIFWTGDIAKSKIWFPGKWKKSEIISIQESEKITDNRLWRCRWVCNAKPDVMIQSDKDIVFIEIKVESALGSDSRGYIQEQTQQDIIQISQELIDWMKGLRIKRINLSNREDDSLTWKEILMSCKDTIKQDDPGEKMIFRHLQNMPNSKSN